MPLFKSRRQPVKRRCFRKMNIKRSMAAALALVMVLECASCGKAEEKAPELMDPIAVTESSRPAEIKDIGDVKIVNGYVVPESYPVFSDRAITLTELCVDIGDYVEEGDLIAKADTSMYDDQIEDLSRDLDFLYFRRESTIDISAKMVENLTYEQDREIYGNDYEAVLKYSNKIFNEQEDDRYGVALIDSEIQRISDRLAELRRLRDKLVFTAPHSGYITFIKDLATTNGLAPDENIALVSDYDDLYIEVPSMTTKDNREGTFAEMYTVLDGKKYPLEEYAFTPKELSYAEALKAYPNLRFRCSGLKMELGDTVPLYFKKKSKLGVLAIGQDSVFFEGDVTYCYVFDDEGQKERRDIITGVTDKYFVEVKAGLEEGEQVYYENQTVMPEKYTEYEVVTQDFEEEFTTKMLSTFKSNYDIYTAECDGMITSVNVFSGNDVTEGQDLYSIASSVGKGDIAEVNNLIIDNNKKHSDTINDLNASEEQVTAALEAAKTAPEPPASDTDAVKESLYRTESLEADLYLVNEYRQLEEYQYAYTNTGLQKRLGKLTVGSENDGDIYTIAETSGRVTKSGMKENTSVRKGQYLFTIISEGEKKILKVGMPSEENIGILPAAKLGQEVIYQEGDKKYTGTCIGINGNESKVYLFTRDGKQYITRSSPYSGASSELFFAAMDDESIISDDMPGELSFKGSSIKGGTPVPARALYFEASGLNEKRYFVWRITERGLSKTYVTIYSSTKAHDRYLVLNGLNVGDKVAVGE